MPTEELTTPREYLKQHEDMRGGLQDSISAAKEAVRTAEKAFQDNERTIQMLSWQIAKEGL